MFPRKAIYLISKRSVKDFCNETREKLLSCPRLDSLEKDVSSQIAEIIRYNIIVMSSRLTHSIIYSRIVLENDTIKEDSMSEFYDVVELFKQQVTREISGDMRLKRHDLAKVFSSIDSINPRRVYEIFSDSLSQLTSSVRNLEKAEHIREWFDVFGMSRALDVIEDRLTSIAQEMYERLGVEGSTRDEMSPSNLFFIEDQLDQIEKSMIQTLSRKLEDITRYSKTQRELISSMSHLVREYRKECYVVLEEELDSLKIKHKSV